ncbi:E3 ubiquitin/ISG15 ligase TRIM25-like [Engystomops pustulosus]|uniref:E3 ubiquitin/ISG15 ligase TRIM25-like n=1 Tax=Engystomops pustulosus TaxID=76066 RepID=UPI003AFA5F53
MASADLRDELLCSICLSVYTDPVTMRCGHNFCRDCIDQHLTSQGGSGGYSCPECRERFRDRPVLKRNIALHNVVQRLTSTTQKEEVDGICCTYCIDSAVLAVKSCLLCEAFLCDKHLKVHSKSPEHVLTEMTTFLENNKCSVHEEPLQFYCNEDAMCICVSCLVTGQHRGHQAEMLDEAFEKKKTELKKVFSKLKNQIMETEEREQNLEEQLRKVQAEASGQASRTSALLTQFRGGLEDQEKKRRLENLEKRVVNEISRQERQVSLSLSALIQNLGIRKDELSRKMKDIEELCNMTDPLTLLQEPETGDLCDPEGGEEDTGGHDKKYDLDIDVIKEMLRAGVSDIISYLQTISLTTPEEVRPQPLSPTSPSSNTQGSGTKHGGDDVKTGAVREKVTAAGRGEMYGKGPADILLDENTAHRDVQILDRNKVAAWHGGIPPKRPHTAFQCLQVRSRESFSSGRHYWCVEVSKTGEWRVGICYPSMERAGEQSIIGNNNKSWSLGRWFYKDCLARHDNNKIQLTELDDLDFSINETFCTFSVDSSVPAVNCKNQNTSGLIPELPWRPGNVLSMRRSWNIPALRMRLVSVCPAD